MSALSNLNGKHGFARKSIIEIELTTGVILWVTPVSNTTIRMLRESAKKHHPDPDTRPFLKPVPNALNPKEVFIDTDNPTYRMLYNLALRAQLDWVETELVALCCDSPQRDELMRLYEGELRLLENHFDDLERIFDKWREVLTNFVVVHPEDRKLVDDAIKWRLPVTEAEVEAQVAYFRPTSKLARHLDNDEDAEPRSIPAEQGVDPE